MSFINISDPKKRDEIVKSYLDIKKRIQQRNINQKLGNMAQSEDRIEDVRTNHQIKYSSCRRN